MVEPRDMKNIGLRGVKVADTRISDVDGEKGVIIYRSTGRIQSTWESIAEPRRVSISR